jgi:transcriptional regulator with XRE-family HTH domain
MSKKDDVIKAKNFVNINMPNVIRKAINDAGLTVPEVAKESGLTAGNLHKIIGGESKPTLENFVKLCAAIGVTPNELLGFEGAK